jgi:hypothetical protein
MQCGDHFEHVDGKATVTCVKTHVQGVVSQLFDFPKGLLESFFRSLKITLRYQWVLVAP